MRVSRSVLGLVAGLLAFAIAASPAVAGEYPSAPPQCGDYSDILAYWAGQSDYTGTGLSVKECSQLCKKSASECKSDIGQANKCSKKAASDSIGLEKKYYCKPLEGSEKKDCKSYYNDLESSVRQQYKDAAPSAKQQCEAIRDACISDCED